MKCRNFRPNVDGKQMPGACLPSQGQVIADLYDDDTGVFVRSAVVADCGSLSRARQYCDEQNSRQDRDNRKVFLPTVAQQYGLTADDVAKELQVPVAQVHVQQQDDNGQGGINMSDYMLRTNAVKLYVIGCVVCAFLGILAGWTLRGMAQ